MARGLMLVSIGLILLPACGGDQQGFEPAAPPPQPVWENKTPILHVASPGALSVGESLVVLGQDFIDEEHGRLLMNITGTYYDDRGNAQPVNMQVQPTRHSEIKLSWRLWPNIVFDPNGDRLGYFLGSVAVINAGNDGSQRVSTNLPVRVDVKPSLIPRNIRPLQGGCQAVVEATIEDTDFALTVEAVGLRDGTKEAPLTFHWTFLAEHWEAALSYNTTEPQSVYPKTGAVVFEDKVESGRTSTIVGAGDKMLILKVGSDILGLGGLKVLKTGKVPEGGEDFVANINVAAVDATGKQVSLSVPLKVFRVATMHYDGVPQIAERFPATQVTDCIPGGDIGRNVTYSEDKAETRVRSMSFQYNAGAGMSFAPIPSNPFALGINFSVGFGVDTSSSVSSSNSKGLNISGQILPGEYGVFYRQTTKLYRIGKLVGHGYCGQSFDLGEAVLTDWMFTPDLATGPSCVPPSGLPSAEQFL